MANLFDETSGRFEADLLSRTVEGIENPASYGFADGTPYFSPRPVEPGAGPNLKLLADYLRSDRPISQHVRDWLADMADPDGIGPSSLAITRRKNGRPKSSMFKYQEAVAEFIEHYDLYGFEAACNHVTKEFAISQSTLLKARRALESDLRDMMEQGRVRESDDFRKS